MVKRNPMSDTPPKVETPAAESHGVVDRILRASVMVFVAHVLLKVVSIVQFRLIGGFCDDVTRDLFVFAFESVLFMVFYIGEEALGPAFLPVFMEEKEKRGEESAWRFARTVLLVQAAILILATVVIALIPETLVRLLTQWDREDANQAFMELAPFYARYMIFGLVGLSLGSTTYMILNGYKRFFLAAFGDAAVKIGVVAALLVAYALGEEMAGRTAAVVFIIGAVVGSVLKLVTHAIGLKTKLCRLRGALDFRSPAMKRFLLLMAPLLLGIVFAKVRDLFNHLWVLTTVEEGLLSANAWGRKLFQTIGYMVPYAVSIAMLPFFCEMVDRDAKDEMGSMLTRCGRLIFLMCAPVAALVVALSLPLAQLLYQFGKFSYEDCQQVAVANICYTLVLPFYALEYVLMQAFFSNRKMVAITVIGMVFSALSMAIAYIGVVQMQFQGTAALAVVALAFTISRILKVTALVARARGFLPCFPLAETLGFLARVLCISLGVGGSAWLVRAAYESVVPVSDAERTSQIVLWVGGDLAVSGLTGGAVAFALGWLLCREDLLLIREWGLQKLRRRRGAS